MRWPCQIKCRCSLTSVCSLNNILRSLFYLRPFLHKAHIPLTDMMTSKCTEHISCYGRALHIVHARRFQTRKCYSFIYTMTIYDSLKDLGWIFLHCFDENKTNFQEPEMNFVWWLINKWMSFWHFVEDPPCFENYCFITALYYWKLSIKF